MHFMSEQESTEWIKQHGMKPRSPYFGVFSGAEHYRGKSNDLSVVAPLVNWLADGEEILLGVHNWHWFHPEDWDGIYDAQQQDWINQILALALANPEIVERREAFFARLYPTAERAQLVADVTCSLQLEWGITLLPANGKAVFFTDGYENDWFSVLCRSVEDIQHVQAILPSYDKRKA